jgi:hypothetical protein
MVPGSELNDVGDMAAELVSQLNLAPLPVRELQMRCVSQVDGCAKKRSPALNP